MKPRLLLHQTKLSPRPRLGSPTSLYMYICTCTRSTDDPIKGVSPRRSERKADGRIDPYYIGGD